MTYVVKPTEVGHTLTLSAAGLKHEASAMMCVSLVLNCLLVELNHCSITRVIVQVACTLALITRLHSAGLSHVAFSLMLAMTVPLPSPPPPSSPSGASEDEQRGITIVKHALKAPLATIVDNAGGNSSLIVDRVLNGADVAYGYDALRDEYVDLYKAGEGAWRAVRHCTVVPWQCVAVWGLHTGWLAG